MTMLGRDAYAPSLIAVAALSGIGIVSLMRRLQVPTHWLIITATLICALLLWMVVSKLGTKGKVLLILFLLLAGAGSAGLSLRYPQWAWIIFLAALFLAILFWMFLHKLKKNLLPSTMTWNQYLKGQGLLLFFFLVVGGAGAWLSVQYGPYPGRISKGGQLLKFEGLDPSQNVVYKEADVEGYSEISIFTRAQDPPNGSATITVYLDHAEAGKTEFGHIESEAAGWSRWDQANAGKRISLVVGPPTQPGTTTATHVDILVFLGRK